MIRIAGVRIEKHPADVKVSRFDLTKSGRTASGRMTMEIIRAGIRRVDVVWRHMPDDELETLLNVLAAHKPFFELRYPDAGGSKTMTCYVGDITTSLWHTVGGVRYWEEVGLAFIEQ